MRQPHTAVVMPRAAYWLQQLLVGVGKALRWWCVVRWWWWRLACWLHGVAVAPPFYIHKRLELCACVRPSEETHLIRSLAAQ
jgi:hypothetical protein